MSTKKGYIVKRGDSWVIANNPIEKPKYNIPHNVIDIDGTNEYAAKLKDWLKTNDLDTAIEIHPDSLPTILSNGSLKPEYQGEVPYVVKHGLEYVKSYRNGIVKHVQLFDKKVPDDEIEDWMIGWAEQDSSGQNYGYTVTCDDVWRDYAIPKPVESKGDVWEEAIEEAKQEIIGRTYSDSIEYYENILYILKNRFTLTKKQ